LGSSEGKGREHRPQGSSDRRRLRDFVNRKLFPYLAGFKQPASGPNTIEYMIGEIFGEIKNKIQSGYDLRDVIDYVDESHFRHADREARTLASLRSEDPQHGQRRSNGGEYYSPRPLIGQ
jgi:type I restriction enzyme M protein